MYFCVMLSYNNGEYLFFHSIVTIIVLISYYFVIYKPLDKVLNIFCGKVNKVVKTMSKKLNFGEKSFKKLLHFNK